MLRDSGITISKANIGTLELKSKYGSGGKDDRTSDEELQLKLGKKIAGDGAFDNGVW